MPDQRNAWSSAPNTGTSCRRSRRSTVLRAHLGVAEGDAVVADEPLRTETERVLAQIWERCLHGARIGRAAHFTELGGTSLMALRVAADVARALGRALDPVDVLRHPSRRSTVLRAHLGVAEGG